MVDTDSARATKDVSKGGEIRTLISGKSYKAALDQCDTLISTGQTEAEYYFLKALALFFMNRTKAAQQPLLQAIELNAYSAEYLALLAALYSRRRMYEESALVSAQALELDANDLQSFQLCALALTRLFRLQEAQGMLQKWIRLRQGGTFTKREYILSHEDPEQLFELTLTVDPFKTKNRRDAFDSIKEKKYAMIKRVWKGSWTEYVIGLMVIAGVISAILFFFRDTSTHRSFSLLIFTCLWILAGRSESMISLTNLPILFPAPFRSFPQRRDITFSIAGIIFFTL
ncbi:MAG: hypothetical protein C0490_24025, partial [Marivirga sp.]|nr:hypothetical protein [Marivirga sp.]